MIMQMETESPNSLDIILKETHQSSEVQHGLAVVHGESVLLCSTRGKCSVRNYTVLCLKMIKA